MVAVGLIGAGIGTSLSPALHEREAAELGIDYSYRLLDLDDLDSPPEDVGRLMGEVRAEGFIGVNVTHPCKQLVVSRLDELSPEARALGAVNTVVFEPERLVGHNTDVSGFREAFERGLADAAKDRVVLVGAGGAGAAVANAMLTLGAGRLALIDAEADRARALADSLEQSFGPGLAEPAGMGDLADRLADADGVIHATPTGMATHPGTAIPAELLEPSMWVADVVYMPIQTKLLEDARAIGCRTLDGAGMVALQAAGSFELFTGVAPDRDRMLRHVEELFSNARQAA